LVQHRSALDRTQHRDGCAVRRQAAGAGAARGIPAPVRGREELLGVPGRGRRPALAGPGGEASGGAGARAGIEPRDPRPGPRGGLAAGGIAALAVLPARRGGSSPARPRLHTVHGHFPGDGRRMPRLSRLTARHAGRSSHPVSPLPNLIKGPARSTRGAHDGVLSMIFEQLATYGHEQVVFCHNPDVGLKAIIAIHNTVLGPALGGTRMWPYATEQEALDDVLRLSRGMTYKNAVAGLNLGGGKA